MEHVAEKIETRGGERWRGVKLTVVLYIVSHTPIYIERDRRRDRRRRK